MLRGMGVLAALFAAAPAMAAAQPAARDDKQLLALADGETRNLYSIDYRAHGDTLAILVLSSELVSVAVLEGEVSGGGRSAGPGRALVTPIERGPTRMFLFDARRLAASLRPDWLARAQAPLDRIAGAQRRALFWGRIEPVGANAAAPARPAVEAMRRTYLSNPVIAGLRHQAAGDAEALARLTAERFASALAGADGVTVAALIDPQPFVAASADTAAWQGARAAFAQRLVADAAMASALSGATLAPAPASAEGAMAFLAAAPGGRAFRISLVARDHAFFVTALEPGS